MTSSDAVSFFPLFSLLLFIYDIWFVTFCFNPSGYNMICTLCLTCTAQLLLQVLEAALSGIQSYVFVILRILYSREVNLM
jgi:F0F1-type ATP synthase membrane subunit a